MGVIHKLRPEIKDYILEAKKTKPTLSCRGLTRLIEEKFSTKVSKSSINFLIKEAGLSLPVGRRLKKKRLQPVVQEATPLLEGPAEIKEIPEIKPVVPAEAAQAPQIELPQEIKPPEEVKPIEETKPQEEIKPAPKIAPVPEIKPAPEPKAEPEIKATPKMEEAPAGKEAAAEKEEIKVEVPAEEEVSGAILLKAVDAFIGASSFLAKSMRSRLKSPDPDLGAKIDTLLYSSLIPDAQTPVYLEKLQAASGIGQDILQAVSGVFHEVRELKFTLSDTSTFYLDGQLHSVWSTPYIPYDFSATIYNVKNYLNKSFQENSPFVLFCAPGYDSPTKEFFDFILGLQAQAKRISGITLLGNKLEELEVFPVERNYKRNFVLGLWPWQFAQYRTVKGLGDFKPWHLETLNKDFYIANIELELSLPAANKTLSLWGVALKPALNDKIRIVILSNFSPEEITLEELARIYLERWPNLEEAFGDYSRKVELFSYMADSRRFFSSGEIILAGGGASGDVKAAFNQYLKALDMYLRWHILPAGYENQAFDSAKERFYSLKATLKRQVGFSTVTFQVPSGYPYLKDLQYALRRLNEREIFLASGPRLWFYA